MPRGHICEKKRRCWRQVEREWRCFLSVDVFNAPSPLLSLSSSSLSISLFHALRPGSRRGTGGGAIALVLRCPARRHGRRKKGLEREKKKRKRKKRERKRSFDQWSPFSFRVVKPRQRANRSYNIEESGGAFDLSLSLSPFQSLSPFDALPRPSLLLLRLLHGEQ